MYFSKKYLTYCTKPVPLHCFSEKQLIYFKENNGPIAHSVRATDS